MQILLFNEENYFLVFRMNELQDKFQDCFEVMTLSDLCQTMTGWSEILQGGLFFQEDRLKFMTPKGKYSEHVAIFGILQGEVNSEEGHKLLRFRDEINASLNESLKEVKDYLEAHQVYESYCERYDTRIFTECNWKKCGEIWSFHN